MSKTISLSGMGAITPDENSKAMSFEFWADDPEGQQVEAMRTNGTAQLMRSGSFFFTPSKKRIRNNSLLIRKVAHGRLSGTRDKAIQLTLKAFSAEGIDWQKVFVVETVEALTDLMGPERMSQILNEMLNKLSVKAL